MALTKEAIFLLFVALLLTISSAQANSGFKKLKIMKILDEDRILSALNHNKGFLIVLAYSSACPSCHKYMPYFTRQAKSLIKHKHQKVIKIDIDKQWKVLELLSSQGLVELPFLATYYGRDFMAGLNIKGVKYRSVARWIWLQSEIGELKAKEEKLVARITMERTSNILNSVESWSQENGGGSGHVVKGKVIKNYESELKKAFTFNNKDKDSLFLAV